MQNNIQSKEEWLFWTPAQPYEDKYFFQNIIISPTDCILKFIKNDKCISLSFKNGIKHYRRLKEMYCMQLWDILHNYKIAYGKKTFFMVMNSMYIQTIKASLPSLANMDLLHFCLICDDVVIDILATQEPELIFSLRSDPRPLSMI